MLELYCKRLQIRKVEVNVDPPDLKHAGAL